MSNYTGKFVPSTDNNPWNKALDLVKEGSTVLDVGCSTGNFGDALIKYKSCIVDGIEPDKGDYKESARRLRLVSNSLAEEALVTTFKNMRYDHIVFLDVVEHLYDPVATLKLVKAHLKPGGSIIFSIPNMAHVSVRLMLLKGNFEYGETGLLDKTHLHFYTLREIERVFAESGYAIKKLDHTEATYPAAFVADQLRELGIKKTPKLEELLNKEDARVFQYVGEATVAKIRKVPREQFSPDPQGAISLWYQKHLSERDRDIRILRAQLEQQSKDAKSQEEYLYNLQKSKTYKICKFVVLPYRKLHALLNRFKDAN